MLQIIGTKKSRECAKAERFAKERRIPYQFIDITQRNLSEKEWKSVLSSVSDPDSLIDKSSAYYKKNGYEWREYDAAEELIMHPELLTLPVLRRDGRAVAGFDHSFLEESV